MVAVALLLEMTTSVDAELTVAVLLMAVPAGAVTSVTMRIVVDAPAASGPSWTHVTT
jgi:hypothetical protein